MEDEKAKCIAHLVQRINSQCH